MMSYHQGMEDWLTIPYHSQVFFPFNMEGSYLVCTDERCRFDFVVPDAPLAARLDGDITLKRERTGCEVYHKIGKRAPSSKR